MDTTITKRVQRQLRRLKQFRSLRDWGVDAYSRLLHAHPHLPFPGRGRLVPVRLPAFADAVFIRLGTSDSAIVSEFAEHDEYGWILPHINGAIRSVIDLGGNFGLALRFIAEHAQVVESAIVVEPDSENIRAARRNCACLTFVPIFVQACIVAWHRPVQLRRGLSASAFKMEEWSRGERVDTVTLPELLSRLPGVAHVDLLKCDIEGAERELFSDCAAWIRRCRNIVVEVHGDYSTDDLRQDVYRNGGRFERIVESPHRSRVLGFFGDTAGG